MTATETRLEIGGRWYELTVEPDEGLNLATGHRWRGYRVKYRAIGTHRFGSILLVDHDHWPTEQELTLAVEYTLGLPGGASS